MATNPLPSPGVLSIHSRPADARRSSLVSSPDSSAAASEDDVTRLSVRPKLGSRKSSGTIIVERGAPTTVVDNYVDEGDVRSMSPRRNSAEVDRLGEAARQDLIAQAKTLQLSLQAIVERVEEVKCEHEKLEGGNKFLQSYIGELMSTSRITSSASARKGKGRSGK